MAFCTSCGKELKSGSNFCSSCGTRVNNNNISNDKSRREIVYEGNLHKCPNCGATVKAFLTVCPECGVEFRNTNSSAAIKEFVRKLEVLESNRTSKVGDPVDELVLNLIRNFNIPNNKEDIFEFIILAASNINMSVHAARNFSDLALSNNAEYVSLAAKNDAWISKFNQAFEKARFSFESDKDFAKIKGIYERTSKSLRKAEGRKTKKKIRTTILFIFFLVAPVSLFIFFPRDNSKKNKINNLNSIQNEDTSENIKDYSYYRKNAQGILIYN